MSFATEELLISVITDLLEGVPSIAVGVSSPIPGSAALLRQALDGGKTRVTVLNSKHLQNLNDGAGDLFDRAAQGRIGAFFLSGGQIDGSANINLVGVGDYPQQKVRWSGSFGSAFLYYVVPRVILFRDEHTRRTMVEKVDFISAPGVSAPGVHRPGGPYAMVTNLCVFQFDRQKGRFRLTSVHPGHSLEEVVDNTGFSFDHDGNPPVTEVPSADRLALLRGDISRRIADPYPKFAERVFGLAVS